MDDVVAYSDDDVPTILVDIKRDIEDVHFTPLLEVDPTKPKTRKSKGRKVVVRKYKRPHKKVSDELKQVVVDAIESGACTRETASAAFHLPYPTVVRIYRRFLETGVTKKKKRTTFMPKKLQEEQIQFLLDSLADDCTCTLKQLTDLVFNEFGIRVSMTTIAKKIPSFHFNLKRIQKVTLAVVNSSIIKDHKEYCERFLKFNNSGRTIIYFDLTEFQTIMRVFRGRGSPGVHGQLVSPSLRKRSKTIMAAMTKDKLLFYKAVDGPGNRIILLDYLKGFFEMLSKRSIVAAVIIMGNAAMSSNCLEINEAIELAGHEILVLPPYSPFLNPVDNMFQEWGSLIRSRKPTNVLELEVSILNFNNLITSTNCQDFCKDLVEIAVSCTSGKFEYDK